MVKTYKEVLVDLYDKAVDTFRSTPKHSIESEEAFHNMLQYRIALTQEDNGYEFHK